MATPPQVGGMRIGLVQEMQETAGNFLLLGLVLISVYVSRIPPEILSKFRGLLWQGIGLITILIITSNYGWVHGILAALAYSLVVSRALRSGGYEGFVDTLETLPSVVLPDNNGTYIVPKNHRWFQEKVLNENPFVIREKEVSTSAVQDMSERGMGSSSASFSR
jgi:hypothetical protein